MIVETMIVLQYKPEGCHWMDVGRTPPNDASPVRIAKLKTLQSAYEPGKTRFIRREIVETELEEGDLKC